MNMTSSRAPLLAGAGLVALVAGPFQETAWAAGCAGAAAAAYLLGAAALRYSRPAHSVHALSALVVLAGTLAIAAIIGLSDGDQPAAMWAGSGLLACALARGPLQRMCTQHEMETLLHVAEILRKPAADGTAPAESSTRTAALLEAAVAERLSRG